LSVNGLCLSVVQMLSPAGFYDSAADSVWYGSFSSVSGVLNTEYWCCWGCWDL